MGSSSDLGVGIKGKFNDSGSLGYHVLVANGEGKKKLNMLAYSGKIIKGHWWWGDLAIDCSGVSLMSPTFPILENHDRDLKIAFSSKPIINDEGIRINPDKTKFVSTDESEEFQKLSADVCIFIFFCHVVILHGLR